MTQKGYFERYFITPFFTGVFKPDRKINASDFKHSLWAWLIATVGIFGVLLGFVGLLGPEVGFLSLFIIGGIWLAWSGIGLYNLFKRKTAAQNSIPNEPAPKPTVLPIDKLLMTVCILFFVFGLLMMSTTLDSGELNLEPKETERDQENPILNSDRIEEEAIFTYQDYPAETEAEPQVPDSASHPEEAEHSTPVNEPDTTFID